VPATALALAIAAALVHAGWNVLLARAPDTQAATAVALGVGTLVWAPVAALTWDVDAAAIPYLAASAALELAYVALLAAAYSSAAMTVVYPIARGAAPVLVLVASVAALGVSLSAAAIAGVLAVAAGVVTVRGLREPVRGGAVVQALAISACIAAYTLVDNQGIEHASPLPYLEVVFACVATGYIAAVWRDGGAARLRAAAGREVAVAGVGFYGSYALTLGALTLATAASVAAVRESSVVIAAGMAALWLDEPVTRSRAAGAALVAAGVAAIALG
jgi:drug/metabolite transporter (DMT)-like permease